MSAPDEELLRLAVLHDHLDEVSYYALLEVDPGVPTGALRDAFHAFALRFHPDQHGDDADRQRRALAVFKRGAEAYRVLQHPVLRRRYDAALAQGQIRLSAEAMQLSAEASPRAEVPPAARAFFDSAVKALERGDLGGAKLHLAIAQSKAASPALDELAERVRAAEAARGARGR